MTKHGWKVLNPFRYSVLTLPPWGLIYPPRTWVRQPKDQGPLCVFSERSLALDFIKNVSGQLNSIIIPCKYIPSPERHIWFTEFYSHPLDFCPKGTALASAVFCLS